MIPPREAGSRPERRPQSTRRRRPAPPPRATTCPGRQTDSRTCWRRSGCRGVSGDITLVGLTVSWLRTSGRCLATSGHDVAGHRNSRVAARLGHVESSPWSSPLFVDRPVPSRGRRTYGVSQGWISRLWPATGPRARPRSSRGPGARRPSPGGDPAGDGRAGAAAAQAARPMPVWTPAPTPSAGTCSITTTVTLSRATINRILVRAGTVTPDPSKRPKRSYIRFEADQPNETWQSDFTHYRLTRPDGRPGADAEIITWLDDHSRYALHVTAHARVTGPIVLATFRQAADLHGYPASTLTDNGMVYTTRLAGGRGGRNHLEHELRRLDIAQKNSRPNHPTTCGKVERFQQTLKKWLRAQPDQPDHPHRAADPARRVRRASTTTAARTARCPTEPPRPPPTPPARKPPPAATAAPTPTTASATTRSTRPAASPCASPADCATSASAEPTPEPTSSCSSRTSTSASSTPPPANSSATSPSTHAATTSPPADHPDPHEMNSRTCEIAGPAVADVLRHHTGRADRI